MDCLFVLLAIFLGISIFATVLIFQKLRLLACELMTLVLFALVG